MRFAFLCAILGLGAQEASATQALRCTEYLHNRDGSWRPFDTVDVLGPNGPVHLQGGDRLSPSDQTAKGDIARALNALCE